MSTYELLAEWADRIRQLPTMGYYNALPHLFKWAVNSERAVLNLDDLGTTFLRPDKDEDGRMTGKQVLVVVPAPRALAVVNELHGMGWKRTDLPYGLPGWDLAAYLDGDPRSGGRIVVHGTHYDPKEWEKKNTAIPYFAEPTPPLPRRWTDNYRAVHAAWEAKCRRDEW